MEERDWTALIDNIYTGNCILVLGPEIATDKFENELRPLNEILSNIFADDIEKERKVINRNDLGYTSDLYAKKNSENNLKRDAAEFYKNRTIENNKVYSNLVNIPFKLVINATHDKLYIKVLEKANKKFQVDYYNYKGKKLGMVRWDSRDVPLIYYLFGTIDDPNSLVISEKNLFEFLVKLISNDPPIQSNISSELCNVEKSFLFLGLGFGNWYLRILLYALLGGVQQSNEKLSRSLALEKILTNEECNFRQVCFLFRENLKLQFTDMKVDEFVSEMKNKYETFLKDKAPQIELPPVLEDAPMIFICHTEEDTDTALVLSKKLQEGGLNPWIDKKGIRGGNDWDRILKRVIKKSDYFIIIQSENLVFKSKTRGYVNKEINLAKEIQREFLDPTISFIYPVRIDDSEKLEELNGLQTIDLNDPNNYEKLIKDIQDDQHRRPRKPNRRL
jgi:hypothetical protein